MQNAKSEAPSPVIITRLIAGAFASSSVILYVLAQSGIATVPPDLKLALSLEKQSLVALVGLALLFVAYRTAPPLLTLGQHATKATPVRFIISYAIADLVSVGGFVLALLVGDPQWSLFFSIAALIVIYLGWPKPEHFSAFPETPRA